MSYPMTRTIIADLHTHSTASDGDYTPSELVAEARRLGLEAIAVTDHDSIAGVDEAKEAGRQAGLTVIPGVEVTLRFRRPLFVGSMHLLMYFSDELVGDERFRDALNDVLGEGRGPTLVRARVELINKVFGSEGRQPMLERPLTAEEVESFAPNVTRRHFKLALQEKHGIQDAKRVNMIVGNDSPAYIPSGVEMGTVKPLLNEFSPACVLAHPAAGSFPGPGHYKEVLPPVDVVEQLLPEFLDRDTLGIDGLEVHYPGHTPEHRDLLLGWANRHSLIVTGGSDCHDSSDRPLGVDGVTRDELGKLLDLVGEVA